MKVTATTRRALAFRREERALRKAGWRYIDPNQGICGLRERIVEIKAGVNGNRIYYRTEEVRR